MLWMHTSSGEKEQTSKGVDAARGGVTAAWVDHECIAVDATPLET